MPIEYYVDNKQGLVFKRFHGQVDIKQLRDHWRELMADADAMEFAAWVTDIREATVRFNGAELELLVRTVIEPRLKDVRWLSAVVANPGVQYGVTNQFSVYASGHAVVATFLDRDEALAWVRKQKELGDGSEPLGAEAGEGVA